ncbi:MAG: aldehyde dehydrogenase [Lachnospiraceae bacterium]|nr:aldehyde dehydrogenase [Lachnospiraceae bacterium]
MKRLRVLINGFGRIGRAITRINLEKDYFDLVAINDVNPENKNIAYLLKYDNTYGKLPNKVDHDDRGIIIDGKSIRVTHDREIRNLELGEFDVVIESSGIKTNIEQVERMAEGSSVKRFIVTNVDTDKAHNVIFGINEDTLRTDPNKILSSSICDVISLAPIYRILSEAFHIESGYLLTLHPWLSYQNLLDGPAKSWSQPGDLYSHYSLGRGVTQNLIPKSTSAIRALSNLFPEVLNKVDSLSFRTPTQIVASAVLTLVLQENTNKEALVKLFEDYEKSQQYDIIETTDEPLVSIDYVKNEHSAIVDTRWIKVNNDNHIELVYWYDNEWGYSARIVDIVKYLSGIL